MNLNFQKVLTFLSFCWEVEGSCLISVCILEGLKRAETETVLYFFLIVEITVVLCFLLAPQYTQDIDISPCPRPLSPGLALCHWSLCDTESVIGESTPHPVGLCCRLCVCVYIFVVCVSKDIFTCGHVEARS